MRLIAAGGEFVDGARDRGTRDFGQTGRDVLPVMDFVRRGDRLPRDFAMAVDQIQFAARPNRRGIEGARTRDDAAHDRNEAGEIALFGLLELELADQNAGGGIIRTELRRIDDRFDRIDRRLDRGANASFGMRRSVHHFGQRTNAREHVRRIA